MPAPLDRELQHRILLAARETYPDPSDPDPEALGIEPAALWRELHYLSEHGLVTFRERAYSGYYAIGGVRITAKGIDFLADDGGLGAILGVVTVRFEADTLKSLLLEKVDESDEPPGAKDLLKRQIRALPAEAVKTAATEGLRQGLRHLPNAMQWLRTVLESIGGQ